jgi:hypothetical protein
MIGRGEQGAQPRIAHVSLAVNLAGGRQGIDELYHEVNGVFHGVPQLAAIMAHRPQAGIGAIHHPFDRLQDQALVELTGLAWGSGKEGLKEAKSHESSPARWLFRATLTAPWLKIRRG